MYEWYDTVDESDEEIITEEINIVTVNATIEVIEREGADVVEETNEPLSNDIRDLEFIQKQQKIWLS